MDKELGWMDFVERLGVPIFLVLFLCAIVWKLLPHIVEWFKSSTNQAKIVSEAIPDIKESLQKIARDGNKLDSIDRKTDEILKHVKKPN